MKALPTLSFAVALVCAGPLSSRLPAAPPAENAAQPASHPVTGIVQGVMTERSSLLVKHEEIPGFMRAMTMMFLVEPEVLETVKSGDKITAQLYRDEAGKWRLRDVTVVPPGPDSST